MFEWKWIKKIARESKELMGGLYQVIIVYTVAVVSILILAMVIG